MGDHSHHEMHGTDQSSTMDHSQHQTTMDPNMDHSGHGQGTHDMMTMYFHTTIGNDYVFFHKWKPDSAGG